MLKSVRECMSKDIATDPAESCLPLLCGDWATTKRAKACSAHRPSKRRRRARRALLGEQAHKASLTGAPLTARAAKHLRFLHGTEGSDARQRFYGPQTA